MDSLQTIKQRFGIIGNNVALNRALEKAVQVAPTDISVLVIGESGVGKEFIPKIIHNQSARKHNNYIAVNCGAIPEGTIDSELFGHEKGAFTGATQTRKGYFEVADGGTIFLDEVGELPLATQVRLLRILESGEFMKVGSSELQKTNVRVVAATNVKLKEAVEKGKFREDLYYRLNTVQIDIPALRERKEDINLLFRKFASDFANKYRMPHIELSPEAQNYIANYPWPGNVRQLRNFAEQVSVIEKERVISLEKIIELLPNNSNMLTVTNKSKDGSSSDFMERELLFKVLLDMKKDLNDLRALTLDLIKHKDVDDFNGNTQELIQRVYQDQSDTEEDFVPNHYNLVPTNSASKAPAYQQPQYDYSNDVYDVSPIEEPESLSLQDNEKEMIKLALEKHKGKRKMAADELGISERTLYRKIKQYHL
ncbi:sigma-54 dependent transcriptional regulator [Empedobacter falsenii]|uniref:Sigma-54-dependent Fis family transcriptional regulator n=1 Tax=Empedobacter stercoris TaxID=1628248 RepID=A0ABX1WMF6_9FLAO|nr:sigma-54 dependent transcriptional regulator [Empedobacter stercoris]HJD86786.1 sigma-54 dependent transcriptional regulator [Empedobacter falsenii]MCA4777614.1 sigma-54-dependent Fis family transcriptional regulator [Empedobacter stercoris]MCA4810425.1 sigma-54-dependent Fis family transcriptional regulator [Empedobacter stercoris]NOJ75878.1 sigma-54-dependent Fis family transcriptional regulator [Empedobacter stercoris]QNT13360.1 sigma-54-dependent Fis family transcriptional regulator [Em